MKKSLLFALAAVAMLGACNSAEKAQEKSGETTASDTTEVRTVECVANGDVVYIDLDYMLASSKLYAAEGKALETKMQEFQQKATSTQESWAKKEQGFQYEAAQLQEKYQKGLITTVDFQQKGEALEKRIANYQSTTQKEAATLDEENFVLQNRINMLVAEAVEEINKDGKYKLIINSTALLDGAPELDITGDLLKIVNEKYAAEKAAAKAE